MIPDEIAFTFRCRECDRLNLNPVGREDVLAPSFLVLNDPYSAQADIALVEGIKRAYFGLPPPLFTNNLLERFFDDATNFQADAAVE